MTETGKKRGVAVGLTGNIASGKSSVMRLFEKLGCQTISTDEISHDLLYDPVVKKRILKLLGNSILNKHGSIDRGSLANIIFNDTKKRRAIEAILHPEIQKTANREIDELAEGSILIVEAPLLFESGWDRRVDYHIMITCPKETRRRRYYANKAAKRGDFERRDKVQWTEKKKAALATFTIDNSGDLTDTISQVKFILKTLRTKI